MATKKLNPITPGTRFRIANTFTELTVDKPEKSLIKSLSKSGGRNNQGRMSVRQRGGGHKRRYRLIDFKRDKYNVPAKVNTIEYDPNRSAFIALLFYVDGEKRYIISPEGLKVGQEVIAGDGANISPDVGNSMKLRYIPLGTVIHNVELTPGRGGVMARRAGNFSRFAAEYG